MSLTVSDTRLGSESPDVKSLRSVKSTEDDDFRAAQLENPKEIVRIRDYGWKVLLLVQFETVFQVLVIISCFMAFGPNLMELVFFICDQTRKMEYDSLYVGELYLLENQVNFG